MKNVIGMGLLLFLAACATSNNNRFAQRTTPTGSVQVDPQQAVFVMGVDIHNRGNYHLMLTGKHPIPVLGGWVAFEPITRTRLDKNLYSFTNACSIEAKNCDGVNYYIFKVPPGNYALAYVVKTQDGTYGGPYNTSAHLTCLVTFKSCTGEVLRNGTGIFIDVSAEATIQPNAITIAIGPGEAIYIGDVIFDFDNKANVTKISTSLSEKKARETLNTSNILDRLSVRPMKSVASVSGASFP